jgi:hypothetical protein
MLDPLPFQPRHAQQLRSRFASRTTVEPENVFSRSWRHFAIFGASMEPIGV